jgi:hypothetical protein
MNSELETSSVTANIDPAKTSWGWKGPLLGLLIIIGLSVLLALFSGGAVHR